MGQKIKKLKKIRLHREGTDQLVYGIIADPDSGDKLRCVADEPCIVLIISGPCLAGCGAPDRDVAAGATGNNFFQNAGQAIHRIFTHALLSRRPSGATS